MTGTLRCGTAAIALLLVAAKPQTSPSPASSPVPLASFSATVTVNATAKAKAKIVTAQATLGFARRGAFTRIDLESVSAVANNGTGKGNVTLPFPQGTLSAVLNGATRRLALWSSRRPLYYVSPLPISLSPVPNVVSEMGRLSALTRYELLSFSMNLVGHELVDGHTASLFEFQSKTQKQGGSVQSSVGHVALADDLSGLPIHTDLTIGAGAQTTVSIQTDLSSISTTVPAQSAFAPPKGYKRTARIADVLMTMAPMPPAMPRP